MTSFNSLYDGHMERDFKRKYRSVVGNTITLTNGIIIKITQCNDGFWLCTFYNVSEENIHQRICGRYEEAIGYAMYYVDEHYPDSQEDATYEDNMLAAWDEYFCKIGVLADDAKKYAHIFANMDIVKHEVHQLTQSKLKEIGVDKSCDQTLLESKFKEFANDPSGNGLLELHWITLR